MLGIAGLRRPRVLLLAAVWLALVVGLSILAARLALPRADDCAISLASRGIETCLRRG